MKVSEFLEMLILLDQEANIVVITTCDVPKITVSPNGTIEIR